MTLEEINAGRIDGIAAVLAVLLGKRMTEMTDQKIAAMEEVLRHPFAPLAEPEVDPSAEPWRRRRQAAIRTIDDILAQAKAMAGK